MRREARVTAFFAACGGTKLDEQAGFRDARPRHTAMSSERLSSLMKQPVRAYEEAIDMAVARYAADPTFLSSIS